MHAEIRNEYSLEIMLQRLRLARTGSYHRRSYTLRSWWPFPRHPNLRSNPYALKSNGDPARRRLLRYVPPYPHILQSLIRIPHIDLMWSDPDDIESWAVSPRGAGWLFGAKVVKEFNHVNSIECIARAHQLVQEGHKYMFDQQLVTVWSAPNYCYRCGNMASIMTVKENGEKKFNTFGPAAENNDDKIQQTRKMVCRTTSAP